jgi:membrane protein
MLPQPNSPEVEPVSVVSVWDLIKRTACRWNEINAPRLGAALSFYTMLSMAPLIVVCIGIAGALVGAEAARNQLAGQIQNVVGYEGGQAIQALLSHASSKSSGVIAAVIGVFTLLLGASAVFGELRDSLNQIWGAKANASLSLLSMLRQRFVSFAMVLGIGFLLLVSLLFSAAISALYKFFGSYVPMPEPLLQFGNLLISFIGITLLFALLYKVVPETRIEWRDVWVGAAVTASLFSMGKFLIGLYLGKAGVGSAYGAAGSLVVFMVWVYYSAQIFFLGAEFTRTFAERHGSRAEARVERKKRKLEWRSRLGYRRPA